MPTEFDEIKRKEIALEKPSFLYHGSQMLLTELQPRTACGASEKDSQFGIYAAETMELVIPFALPIRWYPDCPDGKRDFTADDGNTKVLYGSLNPDGVGYVYKVKADTFEKIDGWQWVSPVNVIPVEIIRIKVSDYLHTVTFSEEAKAIQRKLYPSMKL